jgi:hypothetical protein
MHSDNNNILSCTVHHNGELSARTRYAYGCVYKRINANGSCVSLRSGTAKNTRTAFPRCPVLVTIFKCAPPRDFCYLSTSTHSFHVPLVSKLARESPHHLNRSIRWFKIIHRLLRTFETPIGPSWIFF